jgi:nucleotide-binding universal stress UspA family protein
MKKILAPVDFTDSSFEAARAAAQLAADWNCELHILNVYHIPNPLQTLPIEIVFTTEELEKESHSRLKQLSEILTVYGLEKNKISIHTRNGTTSHSILEMAEYVHADLIVMGMRHESMLRDLLTVNPSEQIIRHSKLPLLLLPGNSRFKRPVHILYATDGQSVAEGAGKQLLTDWCDRYGATIQFVHLHQHREPADHDRVMETLDAGFSKVRHTYTFPESELLSRSIVALAKDSGAELIVVEAHDHSMLERILGMDHTEQVAHESNLPVLILHR